MEYIRLTKENLEREHICCAISNNKDIQVSSKKAWLADRLEEGLVFFKADARGKCFIEYIPAEYAWAPINADGYLYIDCLWVSGQFKGHGHSDDLLDACIRDGKEQGKKGLCVLSSQKKMGFLSDPRYLKYKGFAVADTAAPYFELYYLPFFPEAEKPRFKPCVKGPSSMDPGFTLYYTNQCPFTAKYVPILEETARAHGFSMNTVPIQDRETAQAAPCPFTTFSLYYNGQFLTHEILSAGKFEKLLKQIVPEYR